MKEISISVVFSFPFLNICIKTLPLGLSYVVWTGIGIIGTTLFGMILLGETVSISKLFFIFMILVGILGLKLV